MTFTTGATLLDAVVLAIVSEENEGTYGYKITQDVQQVLEISESTLYPVLRRLQKYQFLDTYDRQYDGRNRRYYKITKEGVEKLEYYREEWVNYADRITQCLKGEVGV